MDVSQIKQRLEALAPKPKTKKSELVDYKKTFWKPTVGKHEIRIVPSKFNKQDPFKEVLFHYGIGGKKVMLALTNFGEKDPIVEFSKQLQASGDTDQWKLGKKISPKPRWFAPVIVRGEEELGVRLWEFGKTMFTDLGNLALDEEIGDYTSITNGRDLKIVTVGPEATGTDYAKSTVTPKLKVSALSSDKQLVEKWLEDQPDILACYKKYEFEEMKKLLKDWLEKAQETSEATSPEAEAKPSKKSSSITTAAIWKSKSSWGK
jgi:hypothetical protein